MPLTQWKYFLIAILTLNHPMTYNNRACNISTFTSEINSSTFLKDRAMKVDYTPRMILIANIKFIFATCLFAGFLLNSFLRPWRWRRYVPPKRRVTLNGLHGVISQTIAVKTSNPTLSLSSWGKLCFLIKIKHVSNSYHYNIPNGSKNHNWGHSSQVTILIHCVTHLNFNYILLIAHQTCWKVHSLNLGHNTSYLDRIFMAFLIPSRKIPDSTSISPCLLPSKSFPVYHSSVIIPFSAIYWQHHKMNHTNHLHMT
jgi:hypothetical protein